MLQVFLNHVLRPRKDSRNTRVEGLLAEAADCEVSVFFLLTEIISPKRFIAFSFSRSALPLVQIRKEVSSRSVFQKRVYHGMDIVRLLAVLVYKHQLSCYYIRSVSASAAILAPLP